MKNNGNGKGSLAIVETEESAGKLLTEELNSLLSIQLDIGVHQRALEGLQLLLDQRASQFCRDRGLNPDLCALDLATGIITEKEA